MQRRKLIGLKCATQNNPFLAGFQTDPRCIPFDSRKEARKGHRFQFHDILISKNPHQIFKCVCSIVIGMKKKGGSEREQMDFVTQHAAPESWLRFRGGIIILLVTLMVKPSFKMITK